MARKTLILAAAALAVGSVAPMPFDMSSQAEAQRRGGFRAADMNFVAQAGASDLYEIESSRLALQMSRREDVRAFAQMMIDHHTRTTQEVTEAARRDGVMAPPPRMTPAQRTMVRQLQRSGRGMFDRTYLNQQTTAHQQALALHRSRARLERGALSQAAASAVPIVEQHLQRVRMLNRGR